MDAHGRLRTHRARRYAGALLALLLALPFSGCVTMAALAVWNTATDERSVGEQAGDGRIATRIRLALLDTDIKAVAALSVFSHRGHVVLVGAVPADSPVARQAVATARGVAGVKRVDAYFYVNGRPSRYRDWVMGLEVRSNIIGDLSLKASQVDIAVVSGHVVLAGRVDRRDKIERAIAHARAVEGVVVVKSFINLTESGLAYK